MTKRADSKNDAGTQRLIEGLAAAVRAAKVPRRALERRLGWSAGYVSRVLNGPIELRAAHLFAILGAIEKDPAEFFRETFPPRTPFILSPDRAAESLARRRAGSASGELDPVDRHIRQVVLEMCEELLASATAGSPAPPKHS